jgi:hypothetical protein
MVWFAETRNPSGGHIKMKAFWIQSAERSIKEVDYSDLADMRRMVGGYIEVAMAWPNGDVLYVNDMAHIKATAPGFFWIAGIKFPIRGDGILVGREAGDDGETDPPVIRLSSLQKQITFASEEQIKAWARANSAEPAVTLHTAEGSEVLTRVGELFGVAPKKL